jgi:hypothetical protein
MLDLSEFDKLLSDGLVNTQYKQYLRKTLPINIINHLSKQNIELLKYHSNFHSDIYLDDGFWLYDKKNNYLWYTTDGSKIINPSVEYAKQVASDNNLDIDFDIDYGQPDVLELAYVEPIKIIEASMFVNH